MDRRASRLGLPALLLAAGGGPALVSGMYLRGSATRVAPNPYLDAVFLALREELPPDLERRAQAAPEDAVKDGYVDECQAFLLSEETLEDGLVSQAEFADMLLNQCLRNVACPHPGAALRGELEFEQLDLSLQLDFVNGVCPHDGPRERRECILGLNDMWLEGNEFGFVVEEVVDGLGVEGLVHEMCAETYEDAVGLGFAAAPEPTLEPSPGPPTNVPSPWPSLSPTMPPSDSPTHARTRAPSEQPTRLPTATPTTNAPTTDAPTTSTPSFSPTSAPSYRPTATSSTISEIIRTPTAAPIKPEPIQSNASSSPSEPSTFAVAYEPSNSSQERFADDCASYLLSPSFVADGIVSQDEFVRFLIHHCIHDGMCDDRTIVTFEELPVGLQLEFIYGACSRGTPGDGADRLDGCVDHLEGMSHVGIEFGFDADDAVVEERVKDLCVNSFGYALEMGLAETPIPTEPSTPSPTASTPAPSSSEQPATSPDNDIIVELEPPSASPENDSSLSRGAVIGMSFAFALSLTAACVVYVHHRPRATGDEKRLDKDPHHFGIAAQEPWGKSFPLPLSYANLGPNSVGSASSSFRDYRFVSVYGPGGNAIPQFNPNTAGAVVIGSVTIGGSSSISSGPFGCAGSRASTRSRSFFTGKMSFSKGSPKSVSSKDDLSSISSSRSSNLPRCRGSKTPAWLDRRNRINLTTPSGSHYSYSTGSRTKLSRNTVPMSHRRQQLFQGRDDLHEQVTFGDWKAVSYVTDFRHPSQATDGAAATSQGTFFFDALLCPEAVPFPPSDWTPASVTCQSLPNMPHASCLLGSDAGGSSILSESYFQEGSSFIQPQSVTTSTHSASTSHDRSSSNDVFVPWRREGFNSSLRLSDSRHSDETSSCAESNNIPMPKRKLALIGPAKALISKCRKKTRAKDWFSATFRNSHYQHLNKGIASLEDPSVVSMKSNYSGQQLLLPRAMIPSRPDLPPNLVLGTFAAATLPLNKPRMAPPETLEEPASNTEQTIPGPPSPESNVEMDDAASMDVATTDDDDEAANVTDESIPHEPATISHSVESISSPRVSVHISALDANAFTEVEDSGSFSPYSRSDFDSSDPTKSGEFEPSCESSEADTTQSNSYRAVDCSFAAASAPLDRKDEKMDDVSLLTENNAFDANSESDEEPPDAVHLIGISQILSESESSEGSTPGSASVKSREKELPLTSDGKNPTVVSPAPMSDLKETQYPSDEETEIAELQEDKECAKGPDPQNPPLEESAIVSDDSAELRDTNMRQVLALFGGDSPIHTGHESSALGEATEEKVVVMSDDASSESDVPIADNLIIRTDKGAADVTALSSSLSWASDGHYESSSFSTMELDASLSTAVPMDTTQLSI